MRPGSLPGMPRWLIPFLAGALTVALVTTSTVAVVQYQRAAAAGARADALEAEVAELQDRIDRLERDGQTSEDESDLFSDLLGGLFGDGGLEGLLGGLGGDLDDIPGAACLVPSCDGGLEGLLDDLLGGGGDLGGLLGGLLGDSSDTATDPEALVAQASDQVAELRELSIYGNVADAAILELKGLDRLWRLKVSSPRFGATQHLSDAACKAMGRFASLRYLDLEGAAITDAGLKDLAPLTGLVVLGSNGEAPQLDDDEADRVVEIVRSGMPSDRPLIVGTGRESTPATIAARSEPKTRPACSSARRVKSGPKIAEARVRDPRVGALPRNSDATVAKSSRSSSARALSLIIVAASIRPSSEASAARAFGNRAFASARWRITAS